MLPTTFSYNVWPSVVAADALSHMTVTAAERAYIIPDGAKYTVKISSVDSDENYYAPFAYKIFEVEAEGRMTKEN